MSLISDILIIIAIAVIPILYLTYLNTKLKTQNHFLTLDLDKTNILYKDLQKENLGYIKKIEHLSSNIEYQNKLMNDFETSNKKFQEITQTSLFDLGSKLSKELIDIHKKETQESYFLSKKSIDNSVSKFNDEFQKLTNIVNDVNKDFKESKDAVELIKNSILSPALNGSFTEVTLENILESLSFKKELDFFMQYHFLGEKQNALRPDAIVLLPNDHAMIIDAKTSKFLLEDDLESKDRLAKAINKQLKELNSKDYKSQLAQNFAKSGKMLQIVTTLMFLPTDHAIEKINDIDKNFIQKAWNVNIIPVGPSGLVSVLRLAKIQTSQELMAQNYQTVIESVKKLLESFSVLSNHASKLGNNINSLANNYDKFAASFNSNILKKIKAMENLGLTSDTLSKKTPLERYQLITQTNDKES